MSSAIRTMWLVSSLISAPALSALAEEPAQGPAQAPPPAQQQAPAAPAPGLPDAVLRSVGDRPVSLQMADGAEIPCRILYVEPQQIIVSTAGTSQVIALQRAAVVRVRLQDANVPLQAESDLAPAPSAAQGRQRHLGLNLSMSPGFNLDVDYGLFHGFLNVGILLPLATGGSIVPFVIGGGVGVPVIARRPNFKLDIFVYMAPVADTQNSSYYNGNTFSVSSGASATLAFGAGMGLHYTWNNGLTLGFKVPVLGYSAQAGSGTNGSSISAATGYFYLASFEALPMGFIGYRF